MADSSCTEAKHGGEDTNDREGYRKLIERKGQLELRLRQAGERAGDAAGINRDWHDNAGYEQAIQEMDVLHAQLDDVEI